MARLLTVLVGVLSVTFRRRGSSRDGPRRAKCLGPQSHAIGQSEELGSSHQQLQPVSQIWILHSCQQR
jgi:hypothetical protein